MYSRKICKKCNLTIFVDNAKSFETMAKTYHCNCGCKEKTQTSEFISVRKVNTIDCRYNFWDDYRDDYEERI